RHPGGPAPDSAGRAGPAPGRVRRHAARGPPDALRAGHRRRPRAARGVPGLRCGADAGLGGAGAAGRHRARLAARAREPAGSHRPAGGALMAPAVATEATLRRVLVASGAEAVEPAPGGALACRLRDPQVIPVTDHLASLGLELQLLAAAETPGRAG